MAETLARKLGRTVFATELGFGVPDSTRTCVYPASVDAAIDAAEQIWMTLAKHLNRQADGTFDSGRALQAALSWRYDLPDQAVSRRGRQQVLTSNPKVPWLAGCVADFWLAEQGF
ncbi:hypothetical protein ACLQ24_30295, partial [Micromonospora sp. DT4]|uniref:hypothetical protein n=1 Tax=Micromonospora sp. DT4 TaxID=3393438 RepID=UPI003CF837AA